MLQTASAVSTVTAAELHALAIALGIRHKLKSRDGSGWAVVGNDNYIIEW